MTHRLYRLTGLAVAVAFLAAPVAAQHASTRAEREQRRETWQRVPEVFEAMGVRPGAVVADIGAGDGFFTARLARAVGADGKVFAIDISADALRQLRARVTEEQLANVEVVQGAVDDPKLPPATLDAILIVNAYHEMTEHDAMLKKMRESLKPGGRLVIIEPLSESRRGASRDQQTRNHQIAAEFVQQEARAAGFSRISMQEAFFKRPQGHDDHWMLVLSPASPETMAIATWAESKKQDWMAPDLRISIDEFKRLSASAEVLVLDVRDGPMYRDGHLPGAVLVEVGDLVRPDTLAKYVADKRPIVAYCSCEIEQTSARVALILRQAGAIGARALVGGYEEWLRRGERVEKGQ